LPTMGCAAAPKPATGWSLKQRMHRFYCRCAADRGQASLLRPSGRSAIAARTNKVTGPGFCAERVGVRLADDGLRSGPKTCHWVEPETTHAPVLLPLRGRSRASLAPTPFGQKRHRGAHKPGCCALRQNQKLRGQARAYSGMCVLLKSVSTQTVEANARHRPRLC